MLNVTDAAAKALARQLKDAGAGEDAVVRLVRLVMAEGGFQWFHDRVRPDDVTFESEGRAVLAVNKGTASLLGSKTLGVRGQAEPPDFELI